MCSVYIVAPKTVALSPPGPQKITESQDLQPITCNATCNPLCSFGWTHRGSGSIIRGAVLQLDGIKREQHGVYRCTASNMYGNKSSNVNITVDCEYLEYCFFFFKRQILMVSNESAYASSLVNHKD